MEGGGEPSAGKTGLDPWIRFAMVFAILGIASEVYYYAALLDSPLLDTYLTGLSYVSGQILNALGYEVEVFGSSIWDGEFMIDIAPECDAVQLTTLLASGIIAFPAPLGLKLFGLVAAIGWLQAVNFTRIVSLYFIGAHFEEAIFRTAHEVVWPVVLILATVATWVTWARWIGERGER